MSGLVGNPFLIKSSAEAGYQVSRSLRFNSSDSAYASRTFTTPTTQGTFTFSTWVKRAALGSAQQLFGVSTNHSFGFTSGDALNLTFGGVSALTTTAVFRDSGAWYHIVWTQSGTSHTIYVNNVSVGTATATSSVFNTAVAHQIGAANTANYFSGYLADIHFIDGQALTPSSFTEVSATTGQLIPKAYSGPTPTGNSFWLPFSDNSAATATTLGKDNFNLGNNWTPNNLSVITGNGIKDYTNAVGWTVGGGNAAGQSVTNQSRLFDGNTTTFPTWTPGGSVGLNQSNWLQWNASGNPIPIPAGATVEIAARGTAASVLINGGYFTFTRTLTVNGTNISMPSNGGDLVWINVTSAAGSSVSSIRWTENVTLSGSAVWSPNPPQGPNAIRINGVLLVTPSVVAGNDSLVDTPTSYGTDDGLGGSVRGNYCTWSPLYAPTVTATNGNLDVTVNVTTAYGSFSFTSGKWYWEVVPTTIPGASTYIGIMDSTYLKADYSWGSTARAYISGSGNKYDGSNVAYGASYTTNDVIGLALDLDAGTLTFYKNGVSQGTAFSSGLTGKEWRPFVSSNTSVTNVANFGQRPFAYTAPSGFKALVDTNLTAPVIAKPSTVMDVALYTGTGSALTTTSALGFSPDFVWIKGRSGATDHALYDAVRGATIDLVSNSTAAETTQTQGLTAFNSNGFSVGTLAKVNTSSATYAAWTWDAGSSTVTNTQGSITSSVRANASAGFSIVTYTGTLSSAPSTAPTVGHGLGVKPALIISKSRNNAGGESGAWYVNHGYNYNNFLRLNTTAAAADISANGGGTEADPTSTVFSTYYINGSNVSGATYVAYVFSPVAGYSSFGSYTGNGSSDGPFIYTGFRPRWIMVKCTQDIAGDVEQWVIKDTTRSTYNEVFDNLYANLSNAEDDASGSAIDVLSNGFKLRGTYGGINGSATYIYAAFAENPFQYARAR